MKTAYVFPGQGSQFVGMGKDLYDSFSEARDVYSKANSISGLDITGISFDSDSSTISQTQYTQPCLFTLSWAIMEVLGNKSNFDGVAGHSLGEYCALSAANIISFEDGLRAVTLRGNLMSQAKEGGMLAPVGSKLEDVKEVAKILSDEGVITVANYNAPGQFILSGEPKLFDKATELLSKKGARKVVKLPVSGAFHSPLMEVASKELGDFLNNIDFTKPKVDFYSNVTGDLLTDPVLIRENLVAQLTSPVLWIDIIENMMNNGYSTFYETGAGKVLRGLIKRINRSNELIGAGKKEEIDSLLES